MAFTAVDAADGFVTLEYAPPVNNSRALSLPLAKAATDFYEVVFEDDTSELTRRNFREGQTIRMKVKEGAYNNSGLPHAYMFAGRHDTRTLLAIGVISKVEHKDKTADDGTTNTYTGGSGVAKTFLIDGNTHRVTFELEALTTDVKADPASTFRTWDGAAVLFQSDRSVKAVRVGNYTLPVLMIDKTAPTNAWITIASTHAHASLLHNTAPAQSTWFNPKGFFEAGMDVPIVTVAITASTPVFTTDNTGIQIPITLTPDGKDGLGQFSYAIPVFNYKAGPSPSTGVEAVTWYLSGGVSNSLYDQGTALDSQGGTIVLGSGDLSGIIKEDEDGFFIGGGWRPPNGGGNGPGHAPGAHVWSFAAATPASSAAIGYLGLTCDICGEAHPDVPYAASGLPTYLSLSQSGGTASVEWKDHNRPMPNSLILPAYYYDSGNYYPVTEIGELNWNAQGAFEGANITSVVIPASVTTIGDFAFSECSSLTDVIFAPGSVLTAIGRTAFSFSGLTSINIPSTVTYIGDNAFADCYDLESVTLPQGLETIGMQAFANCWSIPNLTIPGSVTSIGNSAFYGWGWYSTQTITLPFADIAAAIAAWGVPGHWCGSEPEFIYAP